MSMQYHTVSGYDLMRDMVRVVGEISSEGRFWSTVSRTALSKIDSALGANNSIRIPVDAWDKATLNMCHENVQRYTAQYGGTHHPGWSVYDNGRWAICEFHSVWCSPDGEYRCISPNFEWQQTTLTFYPISFDATAALFAADKTSNRTVMINRVRAAEYLRKHPKLKRYRRMNFRAWAELADTLCVSSDTVVDVMGRLEAAIRASALRL